MRKTTETPSPPALTATPFLPFLLLRPSMWQQYTPRIQSSSLFLSRTYWYLGPPPSRGEYCIVSNISVCPTLFFCFRALSLPISLPFDFKGLLSVLSSTPPRRCRLLFVYSQSVPPSIAIFTLLWTTRPPSRLTFSHVSVAPHLMAFLDGVHFISLRGMATEA
ncbi:hypothetical protein BGY98DRAFT_1004846, partial [Russula aff. rugulosa BPL654]